MQQQHHQNLTGEIIFQKSNSKMFNFFCYLNFMSTVRIQSFKVIFVGDSIGIILGYSGLFCKFFAEVHFLPAWGDPPVLHGAHPLQVPRRGCFMMGYHDTSLQKEIHLLSLYGGRISLCKCLGGLAILRIHTRPAAMTRHTYYKQICPRVTTRERIQVSSYASQHLRRQNDLIGIKVEA